MPEPQAHPDLARIQRVAFLALFVGIGITILKFTVFYMTRSAAVLTDAMESIINLFAAGVMIYSIRLANRPADREHPYGHGKVEFMAAGLEGGMILTAGLVIGYEAIHRLIWPVDLHRLDLGMAALTAIGSLSLMLAMYVYRNGKRYRSVTLIADGRHLFTDVGSTFGVLVGLAIVQLTGLEWVDPLVALAMAAIILWTSWRLLHESAAGLMDRVDDVDDDQIRRILDEEVAAGRIRGYHKVRHRHSGAFHWVDMHLQVDEHLSVRESHELASGIEHRIEERLGLGNATAHVEPYDPPTAGGEGGGKPVASP